MNGWDTTEGIKSKKKLKKQDQKQIGTKDNFQHNLLFNKMMPLYKLILTCLQYLFYCYTYCSHGRDGEASQYKYGFNNCK